MKKIILACWLLGVPMAGQLVTANPGDPFFWDAGLEVDLDIYGVFRAEAPCVDAIPAPTTCPGFAQVATVPQAADPITWTDPDVLVFVKDYYYRVTARNTSGNESAFSNELNIRWLNPDAPAPPGSLRKTEQGARIWIDWGEPEPDQHVAVWRIYKSTQLAELGAHAGTVTETEFRDTNPGRRGPRWYNVTAVNDAGAESMPAGPVVYEGRRR